MIVSQPGFFAEDDRENRFSLAEEMIAGLSVLPEYVSEKMSQELLSSIDSQPWRHDLKRRAQHYGYRYDYKARQVSPDSYLGPLPDWGNQLAKQMVQERFFERAPDQIIVNEYLPGQGISSHVDCVPCFGPVVASLSLGSGCVMVFDHPGEQRKVELYLPARSLLIMARVARYEWTHAIPARQSDAVNGRKIMRTRRVSLTFRAFLTSR
jgi:alkylated DNA repair dioxygenase AlkB